METREFCAPDGVRLRYDWLPGPGRTVILVHGFLSSARINWQDYGTAQVISDAGLALAMPDLRGHGRSDAPQSAEHYPADVLAHDLLALVRHLALAPGSFDVAGYSLGARTTVRALTLGLQPRRIVLAGMGLTGIVDGLERSRWFQRALTAGAEARPGAPERLVYRFQQMTGTDAVAAGHAIGSHVDTPPGALAGITAQTLVLAGRDDHDTGSIEALADALPNARALRIPGDHMNVISRPDFGAAIRDFLVA